MPGPGHSRDVDQLEGSGELMVAVVHTESFLD
jgi:hypothetical protein